MITVVFIMSFRRLYYIYYYYVISKCKYKIKNKIFLLKENYEMKVKKKTFLRNYSRFSGMVLVGNKKLTTLFSIKNYSNIIFYVRDENYLIFY